MQLHDTQVTDDLLSSTQRIRDRQQDRWEYIY